MAAPAPKQEELQPHAVRDQLPAVSYCLTSPPPWRTSSLTHSFLPTLISSPHSNCSGPVHCRRRPRALLLDLSLSLGLTTDAGFLRVRVCCAAEAILLGFQHYLVMLGTTVIIPTALVPQMGGGNVRTRLLSHSLFSLSPRRRRAGA